MFIRTVPILIILAMTVVVSSVVAARHADEGRADRRLVIPLDDGEIEARDLIRAAYDAIGVTPPRSLAGLDWTFDVRSVLDRRRIEAVERSTRGALVVDVDDHRVVVSFHRDRADTALRGVRRSLEGLIEGWTEDLASPPKPNSSNTNSPATNSPSASAEPEMFGITFVTDEDERVAPAAFLAQTPAPRVVVLVHGLDDPGWMWRDFIPALRKAGYVVARMRYRNDGPIADAADLFAVELARLRTLGVDRVDVIAHSMGGLVTRDLLTRPAYYGSDARGVDRHGAAAFPSIERFIMCGTPNHGSNLAKLRAVSEMKEHVTRAFRGEGNWLGGLADGGGEAAADLLPDSQFLRRLDKREMPKHVAMTIIAGRMSPVRTEDVASLGRTLRDAARSAKAPAWLQDALARGDEEAQGLLDEAVRGLGDGCVALDSARLEGVDDFVVVESNHMSMIVDAMTVGEKTPPGIPIALDRLARPVVDQPVDSR